MKIEILGTGCPKCKKLEENAREAVDETGIKAELVKVTDINKIIDYGVMSTPVIVIDGDVKASGRIPEVEEIKKWLNYSKTHKYAKNIIGIWIVFMYFASISRHITCITFVP